MNYLKALAAAAAALLVADVAAANNTTTNTTNPDGSNCTVRADTRKDDSSHGIDAKSCKDEKEVGYTFTLPIRDVSIKTPLGGDDAGVPTLGRQLDEFQQKNITGPVKKIFKKL